MNMRDSKTMNDDNVDLSLAIIKNNGNDNKEICIDSVVCEQRGECIVTQWIFVRVLIDQTLKAATSVFDASKGVSLSCHLQILQSMSPKLNPFPNKFTQKYNKFEPNKDYPQSYLDKMNSCDNA